MEKYIVRVVEQTVKEVVVTANSEDEAKAIGVEKIKNQ